MHGKEGVSYLASVNINNTLYGLLWSAEGNSKLIDDISTKVKSQRPM